MPHPTPPSGKAAPQTTSRITKAKREKGLRLLQDLTFLSDNYPEFTNLLRTSLEAIKRETERSYHSDRERVLLSIEQGAWVIQDISDDTGLSRWDVKKILTSLEKLGLVQQIPRRVKETTYEYSENLYSLTHEPPPQPPIATEPAKQPRP